MANMFNEDGTYNKTEWKTGDRITANKLNKIEDSLEAINNNDIARHLEADARLDALEEGRESYETEVNNSLDAMEDRVQDNIDAVNLELYQIQSNMSILEQEMNEGITEVNNIANTVDGKISAAESNMNAKMTAAETVMNNNLTAAETNMQNQVNQGKADMEAMVAEVEGELDGINEQLESIIMARNEELFSLNNFEKLEEEVDDTDRLQRALTYCVENNLTLFIPHGIYTLSQRGQTSIPFVNANRYYCVLMQNVKVKVIQLGTIVYDLGNPSVRPNAFVFDNCEVDWFGGTFEAINNEGNKQLYAGNSILLTQCKLSKINQVKTYRTNGGPIFLNCEHCSMNDCFFENTSLNMGCCGAAFGIYSGYDNEIFRCISYGSTGDGDISLYGTGARNRVTNCKCWSSLQDRVIVNTGAQGICVDAGQAQAVVSECYAYGYYYGIDVKTNIYNCLVINNVVECCKVSLDARWGEAGGDNVMVTFRGNTILNPYNGRDNIINNSSYWIGIWIDHTFAADIKDNLIIKTVGKDIPEKGTGILISGDADTTQAYLKDITISGNTFFDQPSIAGMTGPLIMDNIYINLTHKQQNVSITNNNFIGSHGNKGSTHFINVVSCRDVSISGNVFGRIDNLNGGILIANTDNVKINDNMSKFSKGLVVVNEVKRLNMSNNVIEACSDWKSILSGNITMACIFSNNIYSANANYNTGTVVHINGAKQLIATGNILHMERASRNEFTVDGATTNVIESNNYIEHTS